MATVVMIWTTGTLLIVVAVGRIIEGTMDVDSTLMFIMTIISIIIDTV